MHLYNKKDIIPFLGNEYEFSKDVDFVFDSVKSIFDSNDLSITWLNSTRQDCLELINDTEAKVIIVDSFNEYIKDYSDKVFIKVKNPKLSFIRIVKWFNHGGLEAGVHSSAIIHQEAKIGKDVYIGSNVVVGKVEIGDNVIIHNNVVIKDNTIIKNDVEIKDGSVIGGTGFGYAKNEEGDWEKFPHVGGVIIESNVDIGSNTCIDRGTLGNTILHKGVKVDNLVHIAHNVVIGENTMIIANTMIAGSVVIGQNTWVAPSCCIRDTVNIGSNVVVGLASLVTKDIPDNELWMGAPARMIRENKK